MTTDSADRPPAGEAPRTEAGRRLIKYAPTVLPDWSWLLDKVLAIEREAASAAPPEPPRPDSRGHVHRHPTGSPMYHDECDLTDRVAAPEGLDVDGVVAELVSAESAIVEGQQRLTRAIFTVSRLAARLSESGSPPPNYDTDIIEPALDDRDRGESGNPTPIQAGKRGMGFLDRDPEPQDEDDLFSEMLPAAPTPPGEERP